MSRSFNQVTLIGNLTSEPELRYTGGGTAVLNAGMATNESYKDSDGNWQEKAQFHNLTFWGRAAEVIAEYAQKGTQLFVQGSINYTKYEDKDGNERRGVEIKVRDFQLLTRAGNGGGSAPAGNSGDGGSDEEGEDELPF
jgi:single-strand DNA-binding protein